jgi:hypothetical protein
VSIILLLATFATFLVIDRFTRKAASEQELQVAPRTEADARTAQPMVAGDEAFEHRGIHQVPAGVERRQAERRGRGTQPAA